MITRSPKKLLLGTSILAVLAGCTQPVTSAGSASILKDMPLFTNENGFASINVTVQDNRPHLLSFTDLDLYDTVRMTLSSATNLTAPKVQTYGGLSAGPGAQNSFAGAFSGLRPGSDYQLKADVYNSPDLGSSGFTQSVVRGEGLASVGGSNLLTLTAGQALSLTVKVNAIGTIGFATTPGGYGNVVSDFKVVQGDTLMVDSGLNSLNSPNVKRVELTYKAANGSYQPNSTPLASTVVSGGGDATFAWTVPTYPMVGGTEVGTLLLIGYDAATGGNQIAYKTKAVTVYQGASVTPVTLN